MLTIRSEAPGDGAGIRAVHLAAFDTSAESELVERIRDSERYRSHFSVVAVADGTVVGHALLSYAELLHRGLAREMLSDLCLDHSPAGRALICPLESRVGRSNGRLE